MVRREQHAVSANCLGASQERSDVLGIFQGVEDKDERWLTPLRGPGKDIDDRGPRARSHDQCNALVTVEAGHRRERPPFDLDDRDAQARGVEHDPFERLPALRDDEQPERWPARDERLLNGPTTSNQLFVRPEKLREIRARRRGGE